MTELKKAEEPLKKLGRITDATTADIADARRAARDVDQKVGNVTALFDRIGAARLGEATMLIILTVYV